MSLLPNVAGQLAGGAGAATGEPLASDCRKASTAGQSAALRTSFHTATAPDALALMSL
jgi:hypothetical protein